MRTRIKSILTATALALNVMALAPQAGAQPIQLTDLNSSVQIDPDSSAGMHSWQVDGTDQLSQQWFWYRIGATGGESSIDTLSAPTVTTGFGNRGADIVYQGSNGLRVEVLYLLTGGAPGSHQSDIAESIRLTNTTAGTMDLHFFQYSDFDLNGTFADQAINIIGAGHNTVRQSGNGVQLSETVVTPQPGHWEANIFPNTLAALNDGNPTTLNDVSSAFGDVTWAYQWDVSIGPCGSFLISKDKGLQPVPEPGTIALLGAGLLGLGIYRRRRMTV